MHKDLTLHCNNAAIQQVHGAAARRSSARRLWCKVHLYIALMVGFMFAFSGLTGSALVFYQDIDETLNPAVLTVASGSDYVPLTEIVAAAQTIMPSEATLTRLYFPRHSQAAMKLRFSLPKEGKEVNLDVMVNPFTAAVLGQRQYGSYLMSFIYKLHYTLALDDVGKTFMGMMGLLLFCSLMSGIYLWWPKPSTFFQALTFKRSTNRARFIFDLHKTFGIYAAAVFMVLAVSGIYMIFPHYVKPLVSWVSPLSNIVPPKLSIDTDVGIERVSVDEISMTASELFPQATLQRIYFPVTPEDAYRVIMRQPGEVRKTSGATQVWISPYDGRVLSVQQPQSMSGGDTFITWMFPLHNGQAFGLSGRIVVFIAGFVLVGLYVTGLMMWWRKRKRRKRY